MGSSPSKINAIEGTRRCSPGLQTCSLPEDFALPENQDRNEHPMEPGQFDDATEDESSVCSPCEGKDEMKQPTSNNRTKSRIENVANEVEPSTDQASPRPHPVAHVRGRIHPHTGPIIIVAPPCYFLPNPGNSATATAHCPPPGWNMKPSLPEPVLSSSSEAFSAPSEARDNCFVPIAPRTNVVTFEEQQPQRGILLSPFRSHRRSLPRVPLTSTSQSAQQSRIPLMSISSPSPLWERIERDHPHPSLIPDKSAPPYNYFPQLPEVPRDQSSSSPPILFSELTPVDVLLGRGGGTNQNLGNQWFRKLVHQYRKAYCTAPKFQKMQLARNLVNYVRLNGGRFLEAVATDNQRKTKKGKPSFHLNTWRECGDERACAKVGQTLREGTAPAVRETLKRNFVEYASQVVESYGAVPTGSSENATKEERTQKRPKGED